MLFSIAYNMLGSVSDAEDMIQETYIGWLKSDKSHVENTRFYLIRVISNKCLDHLKKLRQEREAYTGVWLPEPVVSATDLSEASEPEKNLDIGFMYLLEKLTPVERGVIILKESFDMEYIEIASIFELTEENCRQHLSRAKKKLHHEKSRFKVDSREHDRILREFIEACVSGNLETLIELLREDAVFYSDGGGKATAALKPIEGREKVLNFLIMGMKKVGAFSSIDYQTVNGLSGAVVCIETRKTIPDVLIAIDTDESNKITNIYFIVNPEKLQHLTPPNIT